MGNEVGNLVGNTWTESTSDSHVGKGVVFHTDKSKNKACRRFGDYKFIVNYGEKKYYEGNARSVHRGVNGLVTQVEFLLMDGDKITFTTAELQAGCVSLAGHPWEIGDEVVCYWNDSGKPLYIGRVIKSNSNGSSFCKMGDGDGSWLPNTFIHKWVQVEDSDFDQY